MKPLRKECREKQWEEVSDRVLDHAKTICKKFHGYNSSHEALGVMVEEFKEFIDTLHDNNREESIFEAIDLAAGFLVYIALFSEEIKDE